MQPCLAGFIDSSATLLILTISSLGKPLTDVPWWTSDKLGPTIAAGGMGEL